LRLASFKSRTCSCARRRSTWTRGRKVDRRSSATRKSTSCSTTSPTRWPTRPRSQKLLTELELDKSDQGSGFVRLRQNRGSLLKRSGGVIDIVARGRADWGGWVELKLEPVSELSAQHIARVIEVVDPDILGVVEVENPPALREFNTVIDAIGADTYSAVMVIDGNDDRGIDVGIMARRPWEITEIRSHVDDEDDIGVVFSRDCPVFTLRTDSGKRIVVLVNHLKSKGYASPGESPDAKRERQARRVATIYRSLRQAGEMYIAILGDFNDYRRPSSPIEPLFTNTGLKDISDHPAFQSGGLKGTYGRQGEKEKFDYVLLSPDLFAKVNGGGVCRLGVWGKNKNPPTKWQIFNTLARPEDAASDHSAIYADVNL
jgi:endonuclease/exonuclease/phosphatase family metal-dependent hydrolase